MSSGIRNFYKFALSSLVLAVFAIWVVWYVNTHLGEFETILKVPPTSLILLFFLAMAVIYINGLFTKMILSGYGIELKRLEYFSLSSVSSLGNYLLFFRGGAGLRAVYLKSRYRFSFVDFISTLSAAYLINLFINSLLGLSGALWAWIEAGRFDIYISAGFAALSIVCAILIVTPLQLPAWQTFPFRQISQIVNGWNKVREDTVLKYGLITVALANLLVMVLQTKVAFDAYNIPLSWGGALFFSSLKGLTLLAALTPGSLGVVEWAAVYLGRTLSFTPAQALMAQALMRAVTISTLLVTTPFALNYLGLRLFGKKRIEK